MFCRACGIEQTDDSKFCRKCGRALGKLCSKCGTESDWSYDFCPRCGSAFSASATAGTALTSVTASSHHASEGVNTIDPGASQTRTAAVILAVILSAPVIGLLLNSKSPSGASEEPAHVEITQPKVDIPAALPEIKIADFVLQPRSKVEAILGKPVKSSTCNDAGGRQYEYGSGSYLCVDRGRVILLSYSLQRTPSSVDDALAAVGLHSTVPPFVPFGDVNIWSGERGNPFLIGNKYAHQVTVLVGRVNNVEIDMSGSQPSD